MKTLNKNVPTIFGYTFDAICRAQQGGRLNTERISCAPAKPGATKCDLDLLKAKGIDWLEGNGKFGVLDRLKTSGVI